MLSGPASSGKTTTINMVYEELVQLGASPIIPRPASVNIRDFEALVDFTSTKGVCNKIALASFGDYSLEVLHHMSYYEGMGCDVLICTCRDYFSHPFNRLKNRYGGSHSVITKVAPNDVDNLRARNAIISLI